MNWKRQLLICLGAISVVLFAMPALAVSQEMEVDFTTPEYTGTGSVNLTIAQEPTITCEKTDISGKATSTTTASVNIDLTGCHIFGSPFTIKCRTAGSPLDNTISTSSTVHFITFNNKPAGLYTPPFPTVLCAGMSAMQIGGNGYIGTVISPGCIAEAREATISINPEDTLYTGVTYGLTATTEPNGAPAAVSLTGTVTINTATAAKMTCQ